MNHQVKSLADARFPVPMRTKDQYNAHSHRRDPGGGVRAAGTIVHNPAFPQTLKDISIKKSSNRDNIMTNTTDLEFFSSDDDVPSISHSLHDVRHASQGFNFQRKEPVRDYNNTTTKENGNKFAFWGLVNSKAKSSQLNCYGSSTQQPLTNSNSHIGCNLRYPSAIIRGGEANELGVVVPSNGGDHRDGISNQMQIQQHGSGASHKRTDIYRDINNPLYNGSGYPVVDSGDTRMNYHRVPPGEKQRMQLCVLPVNELNAAYQHHYHERDPDRDYRESHKLITNFPFHPITVADRKHLFYNPSRPPAPHPEGSWGAAIDGQQSLSRDQRVFTKGVVDIHDFKPLCVIGKGSYGKVYLVENRHYDSIKGNENNGSNKMGGPSVARHSIVRETLNWMSNRHWRVDLAPKAMGQDESCLRVYALKMLTKEMVKKKQQEQHTWTENEVLKHLKHPFIVNMHFAFKTRSKLFLCTEYCPGGELFYHLSKAGCFPLSTTKFYAACILSALEYVHSLGIVYRDLKPENVIMDEHGYVKLADFGLAKTGVWDNHSVRSLCGTPEYLAPEVLTGSYGLSVDHWALAALIYEMLTGLPPFYSRCRNELYEGIRKSTLEYPKYIDPVTRDFLQKMFIKDPRNRLGCIDVKQIRQHPFFDDIDFDRLLRRELAPPFIPSINFDADVSYIDNQFTDLVLDDFQSEEPINPLHESPGENAPGYRSTDNFHGWYYDIRYPDHYFPNLMGPMRLQYDK